MKKGITKEFISILFLITMSNVAISDQAYKSMPPKLTFEQNPEQVLSEYPLGEINMQDAFAHHGGPVRKIDLPNGNRAWLYETGRDLGVPSIYVLHFSKDGVVIDVLHKSLHYKNGHSALQYQFLQKINPELRITGPRPGEK